MWSSVLCKTWRENICKLRVKRSSNIEIATNRFVKSQCLWLRRNLRTWLHSHVDVSNKRTMVSPDVVANSLPKGENATRFTSPACTWSTATELPMRRSQTRHVLSSLPVARYIPESSISTPMTSSKWPRKVWTSSPDRGSQSFAVKSNEAVATRWPPCGWKQTPYTPCRWPCIVEH
jgi:hypothetical protein